MRYWVFTSNPGHFRMSDALVPGDTLDWPTFARFKFEVGDVVFIYASSPILQMIGKLEIEELGLEFNDVNPRNELRKWPKYHSNIPWMRMKVIQSAPIPFKPLQRGSLYYHTEFKPSPYPKLLHENEQEYVLRAFDDAMTYSANIDRFEDGINPDAEARITSGRIFREVASRMKGGNVVNVSYSAVLDIVEVTILSSGDEPESIKLNFGGIIRAKWDYTKCEHVISAIRLNLEDTYLLTSIDGADIEILSSTLRID